MSTENQLENTSLVTDFDDLDERTGCVDFRERRYRFLFVPENNQLIRLI